MNNTLADLEVGTNGRVTGYSKGNKQYRKKLLAMGLIKGTKFSVHRVAPMGDPVEIELRGFSLSVRKNEASALLVEGI